MAHTESIAGWIYLATLVAIVCDVILSNFFPYWYIRLAIPVYWSSKPLNRGGNLAHLDAVLRNYPKHSRLAEKLPFAFQSIGDDTIIIRTPPGFGQFHQHLYSPMRGFLRIEKESNSIRIVGLQNWWHLFIVIATICGIVWWTPSRFDSEGPPDVIASMLGLAGGVVFSYWIQLKRFQDVFAFLGAGS